MEWNKTPIEERNSIRLDPFFFPTFKARSDRNTLIYWTNTGWGIWTRTWICICAYIVRSRLSLSLTLSLWVYSEETCDGAVDTRERESSAVQCIAVHCVLMFECVLRLCKTGERKSRREAHTLCLFAVWIQLFPPFPSFSMFPPPMWMFLRRR